MSSVWSKWSDGREAAQVKEQKVRKDAAEVLAPVKAKIGLPTKS
jgi:hypothetical protein